MDGQEITNEYSSGEVVLRAEKYMKKSKHIKTLAQMVSSNSADDLEVISSPEFMEIVNLDDQTYSLKSIARNIVDNTAYSTEPCFEEYIDLASWCVALCGESPTAVSLLRNAVENDWSISFEETIDGSYLINTVEKIILLDLQGLSPKSLTKSPYFRNMVLISLIKALRDIWHENRMSGLEDFFDPENILKIERYRNADIDSLSILVCWELRGAGYSEIWRHILGSDQGDMAMIFAKHLEKAPVSLFNGQAMAETFKHWFSIKNRVNECDHHALEIIDDILYLSEEKNPFGNERLKAEFVENLLSLPDGSRYLYNLGKEIISSPYYAGMNDSVNQTHLLHIIYDLEVTIVGGVPFQDADLAKKIFPD